MAERKSETKRGIKVAGRHIPLGNISRQSGQTTDMTPPSNERKVERRWKEEEEAEPEKRKHEHKHCSNQNRKTKQQCYKISSKQKQQQRQCQTTAAVAATTLCHPLFP